MKYSIICPFFNEENIIAASVKLMLSNLGKLKEPWELIIVNDGSTDNSVSIARRLESENDNLRLVSYEYNRGRGYAIRQGAYKASGDIIVTTEIDSSWGDDIILRIVDEFKTKPDADIIIASPNLPSGGYKNVPLLRIILSRFGNLIVRSGLTYKVTMNTGMTRGYLLHRFLDLPLQEDEKEMHLEIVNKALAFGYRIYEIPAILEWKDSKLAATNKKRKSSARLQKLIKSHVLFSILAAPFRYLYVVSMLLFFTTLLTFGWALYNFISSLPSINLVLMAIVLAIFSFLVFSIGILSQQGKALQADLWVIQRDLKRIIKN